MCGTGEPKEVTDPLELESPLYRKKTVMSRDLSRLRGGQTAVPDVSVQLPLPAFFFPYNDELTTIHDLAALSTERIHADLDGRISLTFELNSLEFRVLYPHVHDALPDRLYGRPTCNKVAVRGHKLTVFGIELSHAGRISPFRILKQHGPTF